MKKRPNIPEKFVQLKSDIQKWFKKRPDVSLSSADQAHRNAEELIWTFQKRYGYTIVRRERDQ